MDILEYNSKAWDAEVSRGNPWTVPVSPDDIARAKKGDWKILLTPTKPVPHGWLAPVQGKRILCLASGGGQQAPILAAAGASVTVLDASEKQLERDRLVADRERLSIDIVLGDMRDLSRFADNHFDLIVHPVSNCFVESIHPVWRETHRTLKPGGFLLSGFANPVIFSFDPLLQKQNVLQLKYKIPYSDLASITDEERRGYLDHHEPLQFGHSLEDQIGGQINAGLSLVGFYEDLSGTGICDAFLPSFIATRAMK